MYILGYSDSVHDRSVCIFKDAQPQIAIEEERLTRVKHGLKLYDKSRKNPGIFAQMNLENNSTKDNEAGLQPMIDYCLSAMNLKMSDIDIVIGNSLHNSFPFHGKSIYLNHHLSHASAAYFASGYDNAAIFVADGYGDITDENCYETVVLAEGKGNKITVHKTVEGSVSNYYDMQNSIGVFYRIGTLLSGFGMFDEGKTMGLSSYGKPVYYDAVSRFIKYGENEISIDNGKLWDELSVEIGDRDDFKVRADIAKSFQTHLEEMVVFYVNCLYELVDSEYLCIGGGTGLNCVSNAKLTASTKFKEVFVFPATGDNGISFGAAYYAAHNLLNYNRTPQLENSYFGRSYSQSETEEALKSQSENVTFDLLSQQDVIEKASNLLNDEQIIMWFQEGSELGPRALGHRSIIASPVKKETKDYINEHIKFRENFRPLAPIVLEDKMKDYFDFNVKSPFMLFSPPVKKLAHEKAPATVHVDNTARLQTLNRTQNSKLYEIIDRFSEVSGVPIILNTSFNGKDEPIVETPQEALRTFMNSPVKYLFIDNIFVSKK